MRGGTSLHELSGPRNEFARGEFCGDCEIEARVSENVFIYIQVCGINSLSQLAEGKRKEAAWNHGVQQFHQDGFQRQEATPLTHVIVLWEILRKHAFGESCERARQRKHLHVDRLGMHLGSSE